MTVDRRAFSNVQVPEVTYCQASVTFVSELIEVPNFKLQLCPIFRQFFVREPIDVVVLSPMRPDRPRDLVSGPESGPEPPFPIRLSGPVIKGFGRGSKEVGSFLSHVSVKPQSFYCSMLPRLIMFSISSPQIVAAPTCYSGECSMLSHNARQNLDFNYARQLPC